MFVRKISLLILVATGLATLSFVWGQASPKQATAGTTPAPVLKVVSPPGIKVGETTTLTITGQGLPKCNEVILTGTGIEIGEIKPKDEGSITLELKVAPGTEVGFRDLRLAGPDGISNLKTIRVDHLKQLAENEPNNDDPVKGLEVEPGVAVHGVLTPRDVDNVRLKAKKGEELTIEVEAQRLGSGVSPVLSVLSETGASLVLARESRGTERDCRLSFTATKDGIYFVQLHDNIYAGNDASIYRLRIEPVPFATAIFPLGGKAGESLEVTATGGTLKAPLRKTILMPEIVDQVIDVGAFEGPNGPVVVPGKLVASHGPEVFEDPQNPTILPLGSFCNGRIARPGEVDRFLVAVKKDDKVRLKIRAADLGSWLDSVVAVVDDKGTILAENDEPTTNVNRGNGTFLGLNTDSPDSVLDYEAKADGNLIVEVTDRYGDGGPEFGYRLLATTARPDFDVNLLIGSAVGQAQGGQQVPAKVTTGPGGFGVFNLKPGSTTPINFLINAQGRPGPVKVTVEGLPEGVSCDPVEIKLDGPAPLPKTAAAKPQVQSMGGVVVLKVAPDSKFQGNLGEFRVVAKTLKLEQPVEKVGTATITLNTLPTTTGTRTPSRNFTSFPVRVAGPRVVNYVGPSPRHRLSSVDVPGVLLQGGQLEIKLDFSPQLVLGSPLEVSGSISGEGISVVSTPAEKQTSVGEPLKPLGLLLFATSGVKPGVYDLEIKTKLDGSEFESRLVPIIVRAPVLVRTSTELASFRQGKSLTIPIFVDRAIGFVSPVELKVESIPAGLKLVKKVDIPADGLVGSLEIQNEPNSKVVDRTDSLMVIAVTRVGKNEVSTKLAIPLKIIASDSDH